MNIQPSYQGYIENEQDALLILQAVIDGFLVHVPRRLYDIERPYLIISGNIFIFIEEISGIKRWTDGITWSPSRISTKFLVYREYYRASNNNNNNNNNTINNNNIDLFSSSSSSSSSSSASSSLSNKIKNRHPSRSLNDLEINSKNSSETNSNAVKRYIIYTGFVKKTISVKFNNQTFHIVSYYNVDDINNKKFIPLKKDIFFKYINPSKQLITAINNIKLTFTPNTNNSNSSNNNNSRSSRSSRSDNASVSMGGTSSSSKNEDHNKNDISNSTKAKKENKSNKQKKTGSNELPKSSYLNSSYSSSLSSSSASVSNSPSPPESPSKQQYGKRRNRKSRRKNKSSTNSSRSSTDINTNINGNSISSQGTISGVSTASASTESSSASTSSVPFLTSPSYKTLNMFDNNKKYKSNYNNSITKLNENTQVSTPASSINNKNSQLAGMTGKFYNLSANSANSSSNTINLTKFDMDSLVDDYKTKNLNKNLNAFQHSKTLNEYNNMMMSSYNNELNNGKWTNQNSQNNNNNMLRNQVNNEGTNAYISDDIQTRQQMQLPQTISTDQLFNQMNQNSVNNNFTQIPIAMNNYQNINQVDPINQKGIPYDNSNNIQYAPTVDPNFPISQNVNSIGALPLYHQPGTQSQGNFYPQNSIPMAYPLISQPNNHARYQQLSNNPDIGTPLGPVYQITRENLNTNNINMMNYDNKLKSANSMSNGNSTNFQPYLNQQFSTVTSESISSLQNQIGKNPDPVMSLNKNSNFSIGSEYNENFMTRNDITSNSISTEEAAKSSSSDN
ncbi:hypothetical protein TPHA_0I02350 [Tetrapisispora phaffii CBS 4417]|uniref:Uncharacterized protein n=1 Tax=Tetrapisispora phaffii (strain ATCC 24235 / CBS 4417 / NBRC 1672 / NRRL Y-8282 / UCD 70-5) TaxID=1071381 RepID=G8BXW0_TETPH|nr:hypothetical protein TPHA_0I02350 [Tetrapisispora phaffii CBS 4417]CCE64738.1 hypothetical protein TPHA_0I02350 [Tetrapisispora phaffii CBS 4417]